MVDWTGGAPLVQSVGLLKRVLAVFNLLDGCVLALDDPPPDAAASIYSVAFRPNADIGAAERGAPLFTSKTGTSICTMQPPEPSMCSSVDDTHSTFYYSMPAKTVYCVTFNTKALEVVCKNNMDMLLALAEMGHLRLEEAQDAAVEMARNHMNLSHGRREEIVLKAAMNTIIMAQEESKRRDQAAVEAAEQAEHAAVASRDEAARVSAAQVVERVTAADVAEAVAAQECINARKAAGIWEEEEPAVTPPEDVNAVPAANPEAAAAAAAAATLHEQAVAAAEFEKAKPMAAVKAAAMAKQQRQAAAAAAAAAKLEEQTAAAAALHEEEEAAAEVESVEEAAGPRASSEDDEAALAAAAAATAKHELKVAKMKAEYRAEAQARSAAEGKLEDAAEAEAAAAALEVQEQDAEAALKAEQDAEAALEAEQDAEAALEAKEEAAAKAEKEASLNVQEEEAALKVQEEEAAAAVQIQEDAEAWAGAGAGAKQTEIGAYLQAQTLWSNYTSEVCTAVVVKYQTDITLGESNQALRMALEHVEHMQQELDHYQFELSELPQASPEDREELSELSQASPEDTEELSELSQASPEDREVALQLVEASETNFANAEIEAAETFTENHKKHTECRDKTRTQEKALGELRERREEEVLYELRDAGCMNNGSSLQYSDLYSSLVPSGFDESLEDANNKLTQAKNKMDELESMEEDYVKQDSYLPPPPPYKDPTSEVAPPVHDDDRPLEQEEDEEDKHDPELLAMQNNSSEVDEEGTSTATPLMLEVQYRRREYERILVLVTSLEDQKAGVDFLSATWIEFGKAGAAAEA